MYTNQVMDNLVRAYRGFPFVQIDYTSFAGTVTDSGKFSLSGTIPEHGIDILGLGAEGASNQQLAITGTPVTNDDDLYLRYIKFAHDPETFVCSESAPPCGAAHLVTSASGMYYWIPVDKAHEFRNLALRVTVMRGKPSTAVKDYYTTKILGIVPDENYVDLKKRETKEKEEDEEVDEKPSPIYGFELLVLIEDKLPNDRGTASVIVNGAIQTFEVERLTNNRLEKAKEALKEVEQSGDEGKEKQNILLMSLRNEEGIPLTISEIEKSITGQAIRVTLAHSRPKAPTTPEDKLDALTREVQLFRLNQQAGF
jgi:hypothetical protein